MSSSTLVRWGAVGFVLAGVTWVALGFIDMLSHTTGPLSQEQVRERILNPDVTDMLKPVVDIVGLLLLALGLIGLHALQKESYGRIGWAGFYTALAATVVRLLDGVASLWGAAFLFVFFGGEPPSGFDIIYLLLSVWLSPGIFSWLMLLAVSVGGPVGFLGSLVGFALLGVAILRARVLPRWCGVLLIVFEPVATAYGVWMLIYGVGMLPGQLVVRLLLFSFPPAVVSFFGPWAIWRGLVSVVLGYALWRRRGATTWQPSRVG